MNSKVFCAVLVLSFALAYAGPVVDDGHIKNSVHANEYSSVEDALMKKLNTKCSNHDVSSCMMLKLVTYFNKLMKKSSIEFGDVEITQTTTQFVAKDQSRSLNDIEHMSEESQIGEIMTDKIWDFVRSRALKWKVNEDTSVVVGNKDGSFGVHVEETQNPLGDARGKKKDGAMGAIIGAAALKIGLLKALAFKALVLLVGKAVLVSKLALVLALILGLKKLLSHEKHVTYEVVAHPHHESHHEHSFSAGGHDSFGGGGGGGGGGGHGGWGRNLNAGDLAYSAHKP